MNTVSVRVLTAIHPPIFTTSLCNKISIDILISIEIEYFFMQVVGVYTLNNKTLQKSIYMYIIYILHLL